MRDIQKEINHFTKVIELMLLSLHTGPMQIFSDDESDSATQQQITTRDNMKTEETIPDEEYKEDEVQKREEEKRKQKLHSISMGIGMQEIKEEDEEHYSRQNVESSAIQEDEDTENED